jgi:hypothetical protein
VPRSDGLLWRAVERTDSALTKLQANDEGPEVIASGPTSMLR